MKPKCRNGGSVGPPVGAAERERDVARAVEHQHAVGVAVRRLDAEAEPALVELARALLVRDRQREMAEPHQPSATTSSAMFHGSRTSRPSGVSSCGAPAAITRSRSAAAASAGSTIVQCAQADGAGRRRRDARAAPDVEAEVVVVAAGGDERGRVEQRHHLEADDVAVEGEPALDVADVQVHVADDEAGVGVRLRLLALDERDAGRRCRAARGPPIAVGSERSPQRSRGRSAASSIPLPSGSGR